MQNHHNRPAKTEHDAPSDVRSELDVPRLPWQAAVGQLITQAAAMCVEHGVDVDEFMKVAWSAYVETRPGMRDYLEELQLRDQLEEIRKLGRMGEA